MSNRAWFWLMLAYAALFTWLATRGITAAWILCGVCMGLSVPYLGWWLNDRDQARAAAREAEADDQAPRTVATWPCPDCDQDIPITVHPEHVIVMRLDPTDVHAHQLTHDREGA